MIHGHESLAFSWERRSPQFRDIPPKNYSFRKKFIIWDLFHEKGHNACIFRFQFFLNLNYPRHIAPYALRIGVSITEL